MLEFFSFHFFLFGSPQAFWSFTSRGHNRNYHLGDDDDVDDDDDIDDEDDDEGDKDDVDDDDDDHEDCSTV